MQELFGKNIGLIICGGIAAYKSLDLIRRLKEKGANVFVVLTNSAQEFITPLSAASLSHNKVYSSLFEAGKNDIRHTELTSQLDLIIIAPATANKLVQISIGLAPDFAGVLILAAKCPILCAPAMNPNMFNKPAIKRALALLQQDGFNFVGPNTGALAEKNCYGSGRMAEPVEITQKAIKILCPYKTMLANKKFIITAGSTIEPIDPVRYISNYSSGKQAFAIARALKNASAQVVIIAGKTQIAPPSNIEVIKIETAEQMMKEVHKQLPCDGAIFAAAVCDWRVEKIAKHKIKKETDIEHLSLNLIKNPDILANIAKHTKRPSFIMGFAAETEKHLQNGIQKLENKGADVIVINNVLNDENHESAFGNDFNVVTIISKKSPPIKLEKASKTDIAENLISFIDQYYFK